jgi:hypothetical protein
MIFGYNHKRIENTDPYHDKERKYLKVFNDMIENETFNIDYLTGTSQVSGISGPNHFLTREESKLVATVIQWLGTPIGQSFIKKVESDE